MKRLLLLLIVIIPLYGVVTFYLGLGIGRVRGQIDTLPTQAEVQAILGVEIDGVIGRESRRVWDEVIGRRDCEEAAVPVMENFMRSFDKKYLNNMKFDDN